MKRHSLVPVLCLPLAAVLFGVALTDIGRSDASRAEVPAEAAKLTTRVKAQPNDYDAWAALGLTYVHLASGEGKPEYHEVAQRHIEKSLSINSKDNYVAYGAMAALWAARHQFGQARTWAQRGLAVNSQNAILYGVLADAELQLGHYEAAFAAAQKMVDISPDTRSLARVSYTWEVRGEIGAATEYMRRALDAASSPTEAGFAQYFLAELKFHSGDVAGALADHQSALAADPASSSARQGVAKAQAALGRHEQALRNYARVVRELPQPEYFLEYGELLDAIGRHDAAKAQYRNFVAANQRFINGGGAVADVDITLYTADHGDPAEAVRLGRRAVRARPFVETKDAYAWALFRAGRAGDALQWSNEALSLGTKNAAFYYHRGMINDALGNDDAARRDLQTALRINPQFHPIGAPAARAALRTLSA